MFRRQLLALCAVTSLVSFSFACGGDGDSDNAGTASSTPDSSSAPQVSNTPGGGSNGSEEPVLEMPASKYTLLLVDVGDGYFTDRFHTFEIDTPGYAKTAAFSSPEEGERLLTEWGYVGGFETGYEPERRHTDVLNGKYYVAVETHLFETLDGAKAAYAYFEEVLRRAQADPVQVQGIGNQSSAWRALDGPIRGSSINGVFHRFVTRRGNMVSVVQTWGAEPLMTVDTVRGLAAILDEKALGLKEALEPTPTPAP